jgi:hypothetical protein
MTDPDRQTLQRALVKRVEEFIREHKGHEVIWLEYDDRERPCGATCQTCRVKIRPSLSEFKDAAT